MTLLGKLRYYIALLQTHRILTKVSGYPVTVTDCSEKQTPNSFVICGNSVLSGVPSPDTPVKIKHVGDYNAETGLYDIPISENGNTVGTVSLPEPLKRIENTAEKIDIYDYFNGKRGVFTGGNVFTKIFDGSETFTADTAQEGFLCFLYNENGNWFSHALCTHFPILDKGYYGNQKKEGIGQNLSTTASPFYFIVSETRVKNITEFKKLLKDEYDKGTPVTVFYERDAAVPYFGYYLNDILSEDGEKFSLEKNNIELANISLPKGRSVYSANTEIPPSKIEIEYYKEVT